MADSIMADAQAPVVETNNPPKTKQKKFPWRPWLRAIHRDAGYLVVGLTFIYALSGIAVNHITGWSDGDPSFHTYNETYELGPLKGSDDEIAKTVRGKLHIQAEPREVYRRSDDEIDVTFERRSLHVNARTGQVIDEGQKPRFFLRVANWLHLNRGKKAWTYVADSYAAILLFLSLSGIFMIAGKKGFFFRGAVLVGLGIAVPVLYVTLAGP
jgi:hypothetical protein